MDKLNAYIHYSEYDFNHVYPTLVIQGRLGSVGYEVHPGTGEIVGRVCICHAYSERECICGVSDEDSNPRY